MLCDERDKDFEGISEALTVLSSRTLTHLKVRDPRDGIGVFWRN
jgi:hypothetical protein